MKSNKIRHVVWDWNGTLMNDLWLNLEILNKLLISHGKPAINEEVYKKSIEFPIKNFHQKIGLNDMGRSFEEVCSLFCEEYSKRWQECGLYPETTDVLDAVKSNELTQSILSAHQHESLQELIHYFKINPYFKEVIGASNHLGEGKIRKGEEKLKRLNLRPWEIVVIGDTVHDYEVAESIGSKCILLAHGYYDKERLKKCKAPIVDSFNELKDMIKSYI